MKKHKTYLAFIISFICISEVSSQPDTLAFYKNTQKINNVGMLALGTWAVTNITTGAIGMNSSNGSNKYFHQMNLYWNTVNFAIASFSLIKGFSEKPNSYSNSELLAKHKRYEKLFLINSGLDVLYIGTGFFLIHRSSTSNKNQDLLKGYGNSIVLQGSFLLVFDLVMYAIQRTRKIQFLEHIAINAGINNINLSFNF